MLCCFHCSRSLEAHWQEKPWPHSSWTSSGLTQEHHDVRYVIIIDSIFSVFFSFSLPVDVVLTSYSFSHINEDKRKTEGQVQMFEILRDVDNCPVGQCFVFLFVSVFARQTTISLFFSLFERLGCVCFIFLGICVVFTPRLCFQSGYFWAKWHNLWEGTSCNNFSLQWQSWGMLERLKIGVVWCSEKNALNDLGYFKSTYHKTSKN